MPKPTNDAVADALMLMTTKDVAELLQCSDRHLSNLRKQGRMPPPVKLGTAVRWPRRVIENWIAAGCPAEKAADSAA